ncbi:MAG: hypothetical protein ABIG32_01375 [Candidatus Uhrbacteria bacterium]|nr:hypothetical protein [Patescibacteria group bacterium]MBU1907158.1 hypothetical protein [Patescibacteria group bacterium]
MIGYKVVSGPMQGQTRLFDYSEALSIEHLIAEITDFLIQCFESNTVAVIDHDTPALDTSTVEFQIAEQAEQKVREIAVDELLTEELADRFIADLEADGYEEEEQDREDRLGHRTAIAA